MKTLALVVLSAVALHASAAGLQNPLPLHNGTDVVYVPGVGAIGPLPGSGFVAPAAKFVYRVYPRQALLSPAGELKVSGVRLAMYDTDPSTALVLPDLVICRGMPSATHPGVIEPDLADPKLILILGGPSGFPPLPCPTGFASVMPLHLGLGCGTPGTTISADGSTDVVIAAFTKSGMPITGGACGFGDYSSSNAWSVDEQQAATLASGLNPYAGYSLTMGGPIQPVPASETPALELVFCDPTLSARLGGDAGLVGLHASVAGTPTFGYTVYASGSAGDLCLAASTLVPPLAAPIALLGAGMLLDPSDPTIVATLRTGLVAGGPPPFNPAKFESASAIVVPVAAAGLSAWSQALILDAATLLARNTQVTETRFQP